MSSLLSSQLQHRKWQRNGYTISTDSSTLPIQKLIAVFESDALYWAKGLPETAMKEALANSLCFGLYKNDPEDRTEMEEEEPSNRIPPRQDPQENLKGSDNLTGFARCITDFTTFVYLTDVWVDPACQGQGLGKWLITCVQEVIEVMPYLRRCILLTGDWERSVPFYEKLMGMKVMDVKPRTGLAIMESKGPGYPDFNAQKGEEMYDRSDQI